MLKVLTLGLQNTQRGGQMPLNGVEGTLVWEGHKCRDKEPDDPNMIPTQPFSLQQVMVHVPKTRIQAVVSKGE